MGAWLDIALKDVRVTMRDRSAALHPARVSPLILIFILGSAFGGLAGGMSISGIPVAIVDLDQGSVGAKIADGLTDSEDLRRVADMRLATDERAVRREVERGDLAAALIIPSDFTDRVNSGETAILTVYQDPGNEIAAQVWAGVVRAVAARVSGITVAVTVGTDAAARSGRLRDASAASRMAGMAVAIASADDALDLVEVAEEEVEQTRRLSTLDFFGASMTAMFLVFGALYGAVGFVEEREARTLSRMQAAPVATAAIVGGKLVAVVLLGAGQFAVLYAFTRVALRVYWGDDVGALVLLVFAELVATAGLAALLAGVVRSRRGIGGIAAVVIQLMALLGGAMFPVESLPAAVQPVRYLSIIGWTLDGFRTLQSGAGLAAVSGDIAALLGIGALLFGIGVWRMGHE